ncbi:hypothetical protein [Flaviaesturariibacter amylovorans]|uniref:hypothetical protein n=1 Tax=Flaviaesturariibacter amylovorans TaxID=1084520 RepID=UPI0031EA05C4
MRSKFKWTILGGTVALIYLTAAMVGVWYLLNRAFDLHVLLQILLAVVLFLPVRMQFRFIGVRHRAVAYRLFPDHFEVRSFWGLGRPKSFKYGDFGGYVTERGYIMRYGPIEDSYLISNAGRSFGFSDYYHRNYSEIKAWFDVKIPLLANEKVLPDKVVN